MHSLDYIHQFVKNKNDYLDEIEEQEKYRKDICPSIGTDIGNLIYLLIQITQAEKVLEIGTCLGYSTIWLAEALKKTKGTLTSIEISERLFAETKKNIAKAALTEYVNLVNANALDYIPKINDTFDIILQDSKKDLYLPLLDICVEKLKPGGILLSDDVLFPILNIRQKQKDILSAYNQAVFNHPLLESTILPLGDGLTISYKKF